MLEYLTPPLEELTCEHCKIGRLRPFFNGEVSPRDLYCTNCDAFYLLCEHCSDPWKMPPTTLEYTDIYNPQARVPSANF
jgi:hypothetical protein